MEPVDGFTVEHTDDGNVILVLTSRYGTGEEYTLNAPDAEQLGLVLIVHARLVMRKE